MSNKKRPFSTFHTSEQSEAQMHFDFPNQPIGLQKELKKRYYSIGEVAQMFGVNTSLLRYWETEFPLLHPKKNRQGKRLYTQKDVENVRMIYLLVKKRGYTLEGAKKKLKENRGELDNQLKVIDTLQNIRAFLVHIRDNLGE